MADIGQVLFCVFMHRDEVAVNKNAKKGVQYPAILTSKASLKKNLLFDQEENFFLWDLISSGQYMLILHAWIANQKTGFSSSCPLADSAIIRFRPSPASKQNNKGTKELSWLLEQKLCSFGINNFHKETEGLSLLKSVLGWLVSESAVKLKNWLYGFSLKKIYFIQIICSFFTKFLPTA